MSAEDIDGWQDIDGEVLEAERLRRSCFWILGFAIAGYVLIGVIAQVFAVVLDVPGLAVIGWAWPLAVLVILLGLGALW